MRSVLNLLRRQRLTGIGRRHTNIRILTGDTGDQFTVGDIARHDGGISPQIGGRSRLRIEPQVRLAVCIVRPVTGKAGRRQNRSYIPLKSTSAADATAVEIDRRM